MSPMLIFLPVRNGAAYIGEAIRSVAAQRDPDWRLIVLENGSTDDTVAIVQAFADPRITLLPAARPLDIVANWRRIGEWLDANDAEDALVTTIGHDDGLDPGFVGDMRQLAAAHPDATLFQAGFDLIDARGRRIRPCRPAPASESWQELAAALCWGLRDSYGTGHVFRARDYRAVGGFPDLPELLYADHLLFVRLARRGRKCGTPAILCRYRLHAASASSSVSRRTLNAYVEALDRFVAALTAEAADFTGSELGRNALCSLLARDLANLGRPAIRPLLSAPNRDRLARFAATFADLSPDAGPDAWLVSPRPRWMRPLERAIDTLVVTRIRWRERRRT